MNSSASVKKEKVLQMLASLTPSARMAVLSAALEQKALREDVHKSESQEEERVRCTLISK